MPYRYRANDFYNAVQWAVGLELFLLIDDPWRVFFTTDHPNGAPFTAYPDILALLMDRDLRAQWIATLPPHINVNLIELMPTCQGYSALTIKRDQSA